MANLISPFFEVIKVGFDKKVAATFAEILCYWSIMMIALYLFAVICG